MLQGRQQKKQARAKKRMCCVCITLALLLCAGIACFVCSQNKTSEPLLTSADNAEKDLSVLMSELPSETSSYLSDWALQGDHVVERSEVYEGSIGDVCQRYLQSEEASKGLLFGDYVDFFHNTWASIIQKSAQVEVCVIKASANNTCEVKTYELSV